MIRKLKQMVLAFGSISKCRNNGVWELLSQTVGYAGVGGDGDLWSWDLITNTCFPRGACEVKIPLYSLHRAVVLGWGPWGVTWLLQAVTMCRAFPGERLFFFLIILLFKVTLMLGSVDNTEEKLMLLMRLAHLHFNITVSTCRVVIDVIWWRLEMLRTQPALENASRNVIMGVRLFQTDLHVRIGREEIGSVCVWLFRCCGYQPGPWWLCQAQ